MPDSPAIHEDRTIGLAALLQTVRFGEVVPSFVHVGFVRCHFEGPAVFALGSGTLFRGVQTIEPRGSHLRDILWLVDSHSTPAGAIPFYGCLFADCTFSHIGFAVTEEVAAAVREHFEATT